MPAHDSARGLLIPLFQCAEKRAVMRKMTRIVEGLVLWRDVRKPGKLRLVVHPNKQRISGARKEEPVESVMRGLGGRHILDRNGFFQGRQRTLELGNLSWRYACGGQLCALLSDVGSRFIRDSRD